MIFPYVTVSAQDVSMVIGTSAVQVTIHSPEDIELRIIDPKNG